MVKKNQENTRDERVQYDEVKEEVESTFDDVSTITKEEEICTITKEENETVPSKEKKKKVVKRIMTPLQAENLVKARARVLELRKQIKEKEKDITPKGTKLEKRLDELNKRSKSEPSPPPPRREPSPPPPRPSTPHVKKSGYKFITKNGYLYMEEE